MSEPLFVTVMDFPRKGTYSSNKQAPRAHCVPGRVLGARGGASQTSPALTEHPAGGTEMFHLMGQVQVAAAACDIDIVVRGF